MQAAERAQLQARIFRLAGLAFWFLAGEDFPQDLCSTVGVIGVLAGVGEVELVGCPARFEPPSASPPLQRPGRGAFFLCDVVRRVSLPLSKLNGRERERADNHAAAGPRTKPIPGIEVSPLFFRPRTLT